MWKVAMYTAEPVLTRETTEKLEKILDSTYWTSDLEHVAAITTQMNAEERTQLLRILKYFEELFDGILGDWDTEPVALD